MPQLTQIPVQLGPKSHPILIGRGLFPSKFLRLPLLRDPQAQFWIVSDRKLQAQARRLVKGLGKRCLGTAFLRGGDAHKNIHTLQLLYTAAARAGLDRQSIVIAIGGGVVGDVTAFFAATYLRGLRVVHLPTTLIAQVDSAIGGKTGINLPEGKNLVGAFHQPSLVAVDPLFLNTLSQREFIAGLAEVVKYGIIADPVLFTRLESHRSAILNRESGELSRIIDRCCRIKADVVSKDEFETQGLRSLLNYGHTLGHAIESASHYSLLHGEAIALGMRGATWLSEKLLKLRREESTRILNLIRSLRLPTTLPKSIRPAPIMKAIRLDKKNVSGSIRFVLAPHIGTVKSSIPVPEALIQDTIRKLYGSKQ